jgi:hypothetical protein
MSEIRYIILSDLHLGAANSILTALDGEEKNTVPGQANELLTQLARCLGELAAFNHSSAKPAFIFNGDCLELALAGMNEAAMAFQRFLALTFVPSGQGVGAATGRFHETAYCLPGNHDHHLWNLARETQYIENYIDRRKPGDSLAPEFYATNMFMNAKLHPVRSGFLDAVARQVGLEGNPSFLAVYPNLALYDPGRDRCVVIHHGHYVESIYSLISTLNTTLFPDSQPPDKIWDLESDNGAWVDFFWSTLGRSGQAGEDVELIYDKMQSAGAFDALLRNLAKAIAPGIPPRSRWLFALKRRLVGWALRGTLGRLAMREAQDTGGPLSADTAAGLANYMEKYVYSEIARGNAGKIPADTTFIFGHTHKPFEDQRAFKGFSQPVKVLNSGGWVVDTLAPDPLHGGAVMVVDDELNVASIRMYQEGAGSDGRVQVKAATAGENPLYDQLKRGIDPNAEPWKSLGVISTRAVDSHRENLRRRVRSRT